jgi:circadian clock protein KaiC
MKDKFTLGYLSTGVPGLDTLLGGGLSEFSFNMIAGSPGSGKTTLAHQIMFALAHPQRKALFFTVLGEPPLKMLRYQQQYSFFDIDKIGTSIRYVNLAEDLQAGNFTGVLDRIMKEVADFSPGLVFVDSFKSVAQARRSGTEGIADLQQFVQALCVRMASWEATSFLIGEYDHAEFEANPVTTVADGLFTLSHDLEHGASVRKVRIIKMRGQPHLRGAHTFRITDDGLTVFPRLLPPLPEGWASVSGADGQTVRIGSGVAILDELLGGGIPRGHAALVAGPPGAGKTKIATAFLAEGVRCGEKGVLGMFDRRAITSRNSPLAQLVHSNDVVLVERRSRDLSIEELVEDLRQAVVRTNAKRVVIDSLSHLAFYLAPEFRDDLNGSLFQALSSLAVLDVTVLVTMDVASSQGSVGWGEPDASAVADVLILMRRPERGGQRYKEISVLKVRDHSHNTDTRLYEINQHGLQIAASHQPREATD